MQQGVVPRVSAPHVAADCLELEVEPLFAVLQRPDPSTGGVVPGTGAQVPELAVDILQLLEQVALALNQASVPGPVRLALRLGQQFQQRPGLGTLGDVQGLG